MSTENELKEFMGLVGAFAQDTALYMRDVVQINKVEKSAKVLEDRLRALLAELDAAREDAARYRWLRQQPNDCCTPRIDICYWTCEDGDSVNTGEGLRGEDADKAIDAARKGEA